MIYSLSIATALVVSTIFVHYEALRLMGRLIPLLRIPVRAKVLFVVFGCFAAHTVEVWLYAFSYALIGAANLGNLHGEVDGRFVDYLYFSATSYSTLGLGDVFPSGVMRLVSGIEGVNGLFLIAWSTSFTYVVMDRLWPLHPESKVDDP